jgi:hypothetical protein
VRAKDTLQNIGEAEAWRLKREPFTGLLNIKFGAQTN